MMNKGTYKNFNGETVEFNFENELSLSQKANFVMEMAGMIVSGTIGYASILKEAIFNYCLVKYFTDIVLFENDDDFSLDMIDTFLNDNKETVIGTITKAMGEETFNKLSKACDETIEFRKAHFSDYKEEISDLLQVVREFVLKPDYLNELMIAITNAVNSFAEKDNIDMDVVNKLVDVLPVMKELGSKEVAKAIVEEFHQNTPNGNVEDKPRAKRGRPKKDNNLEVVK